MTKKPIQKSMERAEGAALMQVERLLGGVDAATRVCVAVGDAQVELPYAVVALMRDYAGLRRRGLGGMLVASERTLSTQAAADILNVSRPYFVRLVDAGEVPHTRVGNRRRVILKDVMAYKTVRDAERRGSLAELVRLEREAGMFEEEDA